MHLPHGGEDRSRFCTTAPKTRKTYYISVASLPMISSCACRLENLQLTCQAWRGCINSFSRTPTSCPNHSVAAAYSLMLARSGKTDAHMNYTLVNAWREPFPGYWSRDRRMGLSTRATQQ